MKFSIYTLGCKVNQYETQAMEQILTNHGHQEGRIDEICDAYIINTCTVTAVSDKKSRNMIRRLRRLNPAAVVAVCGCYAQVDPEAVRALEEAVAQALDCARAGYRELVVTGIEISSWGRDLPGRPPLSQLVAALCEAVPDCRVRLGSLEPRTVDEAFCKALSGFSNLCPQFHLSLQSGSDTVLKRMNRRYDTARYLESVRLLEQYFPGCAVTTDLIVAFPGETEAEFEESLQFLRRCRLAKVHVFPYSRRAGTKAAAMAGQWGNAVKEARSAAAQAVARELEEAYQRRMVGQVYPVLLEETQGAYTVGHAPNYVRVCVPGDLPRNRVLPVRITGLHQDGVVGAAAEAVPE